LLRCRPETGKNSARSKLFIPGAAPVGSTDVDLALDHRALEDPGYSPILKKLQERGDEQSEKQPFM